MGQFFLLQNATKVYYKMHQIFHYKMQRLLQTVSECLLGLQCVKSVQIRSFSWSTNYDQKRKLFRTISFVLAHSSAKKIYNEQLTLKPTIQWYHMTECDVI